MRFRVVVNDDPLPAGMALIPAGNFQMGNSGFTNRRGLRHTAERDSGVYSSRTNGAPRLSVPRSPLSSFAIHLSHAHHC